MKFDIVKKGYDPSQVDESIRRMTESNNAVVTEQKVAIEQLKEENHALTEKLNNYDKRKEEIFVALVEAQELSAKLKRKAQQRFDEEMERLILFQNKWTSYAKNIVKTLTPDEAEKFNEMSEKFQSILAVYAKDVTVANPEVKSIAQGNADVFNPLKKVTKFLETLEDVDEVDEEISAEQESVQSAQDVDGEPAVVVVDDQDYLEDGETAVEEIAEEQPELKSTVDLDKIIAQEEKTQVDINKVIEQGEKTFIDIDDAIEAEVKNTHNIDKVIAQEEEKVVQDITQEDILNVNQSLEELCRELGIGDSEEE